MLHQRKPFLKVLKEVIQTNLRSMWLITPNVASDLIERYGNVLNDPKSFMQMAREKPEPKASDDDYITQSSFASQFTAETGFNLIGNYQLRTGQVPEDSVCVLSVTGVLMKYDSCGAYGTSSIAELINKATSNPNIVGIILELDTPGGNVAGVRLAADAVNKAKLIKPVVAWISDGVCASGGYWIASQCSEIISSHDTNIIGSIGVMIGLRDDRQMKESLGVKDIVVYADGSEEKNLEFRQAIEGDFTGLKAKMLNPVRKQFVAAVKSGRGDKLKKTAESNPLKGGIYGDKSSVDIGLVDSIGDLQAAANSVIRQAKTMKKNSSNTAKSSTNTDEQMKMKLTVGKHDSLIAIMGLKPEAGQTEFEVDAADFHTAQQQATANQLAAITGSIEQVTAAVQTLTETSSTSAQSITALQDEVKTIGEAAGVIQKSQEEKGSQNTGGKETTKGRLYINRN